MTLLTETANSFKGVKHMQYQQEEVRVFVDPEKNNRWNQDL